MLLAHINQHLEAGLGLRQILDWAVYVDRVLDDEMWKHTFAPMVRHLGLETLAMTVTRMCQLYLGLRTDITWCSTADEDICHHLMDYVMDQGNFGRKGNTDSHKTVIILRAMQNLSSFFQKIQRFGLVHWQDTTKHPHLKPLFIPFAWLWQLCRYIHLGLKREQPFKSLMQDVKKSRDKDNLMESLGINRR